MSAMRQPGSRPQASASWRSPGRATWWWATSRMRSLPRWRPPCRA